MTREQVALLLAKASAAFSNSAPNLKQNPQIFEVWCEMLYDFDAQTALNNLHKHVKASTFFPTIADIVRVEPESTTHGEALLLEGERRLEEFEQWKRNAVPPPEHLLRRNKVKPIE